MKIIQTTLSIDKTPNTEHIVDYQSRVIEIDWNYLVGCIQSNTNIFCYDLLGRVHGNIFPNNRMIEIKEIRKQDGKAICIFKDFVGGNILKTIFVRVD